MITYEKVSHSEKLKDYNVLTNQDTLRNLNSSGFGIALIGTAVVICRCCHFCGLSAGWCGRGDWYSYRRERNVDLTSAGATSR